MRDLLAYYNEGEQNTTPTRAFRTLALWSTRYGWQKRAETYDAELERRKNERAEQIMQSGLALTHERVVKLRDLADFLENQLYEQGEGDVYHNVWLPDAKQIGGERVDIERFNAPIFSEFRAALDDLAKETGGRKANLNLTVKKEEDIVNEIERELAELANSRAATDVDAFENEAQPEDAMDTSDGATD